MAYDPEPKASPQASPAGGSSSSTDSSRSVNRSNWKDAVRGHPYPVQVRMLEPAQCGPLPPAGPPSRTPDHTPNPNATAVSGTDSPLDTQPALDHTPNPGMTSVDGPAPDANRDASPASADVPAPATPLTSTGPEEANADASAADAPAAEAIPAATRDKRGRVTTTMASLETVRATLNHYQAVATRVRQRTFVNPALLSRFIVKSGGPREQIFGKLARTCVGLYKLLDESEDLAAKIPSLEAKAAAAPQRKSHAVALEKARTKLAGLAEKIIKKEADALAMVDEVRAKLIKHVQSSVDAAQKAVDKANKKVSDQDLKLQDTQAKERPQRTLSQLEKALEKAKKAQSAAASTLEDAEKLLEESESLDILVQVTQTEWTITYNGPRTAKEAGGKGKPESYQLRSPKGGINTDRPDGFVHGGDQGFTDDDFKHAAQHADLGLRGEARQTALAGAAKSLEVIRKHEGKTDSVNTWDRAVLTFGPGLAAFGVLESVFERLSLEEPAFFTAEVAAIGLGVEGRKFVVTDAETGKVLKGQDAKEYIANNPVLVGALRRICGKPEVRQVMAVRTYETSIKQALNWTFKVTGPEEVVGSEAKGVATVTWATLTEGVDKSLVGAAQTVIASYAHASGNTRVLQSALSDMVVQICRTRGETVAEVMLDEATRVELVRAIIAKVRDDTWAKGINDQFGEGTAPLKSDKAKK